MDAKTIIAIVLVVFIVGAAVWLNIRNRKNKSVVWVAERCRPFFYGGNNEKP